MFNKERRTLWKRVARVTDGNYTAFRCAGDSVNGINERVVPATRAPGPLHLARLIQGGSEIRSSLDDVRPERRSRERDASEEKASVPIDCECAGNETALP